MTSAAIKSPRRNLVDALAALERIEAVFMQLPGGGASPSARQEAERWAYVLSLRSNDPFCREKASFLLAYSEDYFSDRRHAKYGVGSAQGLSVLRDRIFATIDSIRSRLRRIDSGVGCTAARLTKF